MKRNTLLLVAIAIAGVFLVFNPVRACQDRNPTVGLPPQDGDVLAPLVAWASTARLAPADAVVRSFDAHDVVFLGEYNWIREHAALVRDLLPALHAAGVRNLGIEFALSASQPDIDALLSAPAWDETEARRITFAWSVIWGFQEYLDVYHAAWKLNRGLPAGAPPFRIVGLGVRQNWEFLQTERDAENAEILSKVLAGGIPDEHMAGIIQREFLDTGQKALVYCSLQHAFTRYRSTEYEKAMKEKGFTETRRAGNILFDRVGGRVATLALHAPWPDSSSRIGIDWPVGGTIDSLLLALPVERQEAGWSTAGTPLGGLAIRSGAYAAGHAKLTLADLCDGYIATGPIPTLHASTAIPDFVPEDMSDYAARNFPGPKTAKFDAAMINAYIADVAQSLEQALRRFK